MTATKTKAKPKFRKDGQIAFCTYFYLKKQVAIVKYAQTQIIACPDG